MRLFLLLWIMTMPISSFAKSQEWDEFNSSLCIEVTRPNGVFTCTGVAISSNIVVTAAHCLDGEILKVRIFTDSFYNRNNKSLVVKGFKTHPNYKPKSSQYLADVAKIFLDEKLPSNIKILPIFRDTIVYGNLYRFGFGERNKKNLRTVITPTFRMMDLQNKTLELYDTFSYSGDSGGPIYLKQNNETYVLAVHSTLSFGPQGKFSYNPLLGSYYNWIFEN